METATYLLFLLGILGAVDIAIFHSIAHGIRSRPDSVMELFTHSLRGPTYATLFVIIPNFRMQGAFAWVLIAIFVIDLGISIWDFWLEQGSRRFLGGLPSGEYVLHTISAMLFGALVTSVMFEIGTLLKGNTGFVYSPANVPWLLRAVMLIMAALVLVSGMQEAFAALRLKGAKKRNPTEDPIPAGSICVAQEQPTPTTSPFWMRLVLNTAGVYNLLWGAFVICFPMTLFRWADMPPINYPGVWQCVGMVVGVHGVGYLIAARDPFRHWPVILVGLLGKVFGPIGMLWAISNGQLPWQAGLACVTNDLIGWIPFGLVLYGAYKYNHRLTLAVTIRQ
jgi:hypothetical protein